MADTTLEPPFPAYSGTKPFIFVSYAHKDAATVFPELQALHDAGYRIWFDEGIDPGNEWPEEIANALNRAAKFLVFLSPAAVVSRNVRNEIHLALQLGKDFLAVYLSDTKLPPGLQLSISSIQAVLRHQMSTQNYWRKLEKALPDMLCDVAVVQISRQGEGHFGDGANSPEEVNTDANRRCVITANQAEFLANPVRNVKENFDCSQGPWTNSLGQIFVPVADLNVLFGIWDVRVQDYRAYAAANHEVDGSWRKPDFFGQCYEQDDMHPVVMVNWRDMHGYCKWLTKRNAEGD